MSGPDDPADAGTPRDAGSPGGPASLSRGELRAATLAGIRWTTLARLVAEVVAFGASVVLARVIPPAEFGRAAIALVAPAVAGVVMSQGIGAALVQMRSAQRSDLQTATLLALASGVAFAALAVAFCELLIAPVLGDRIATLTELASAAFLLSAFGAVPQAVLRRRLNFQRLATIQVSSLLVGTATSVALAAAAGIDGEALVVGVLVSAAVASALSLASVGPEAPRLDRGSARRISAFGVQSGLAALFYTVFRRVDYAILASRLSAADVGIYWRAYQLGVEYQSKVTTVMLRITFPVFSRTASLADMRAIRARTVRLHAAVVLPPLAAFIAMAPVLVPWLYGEAWERSVVPAQILAVVGMGAAIVTGIGPLLLAVGRARVLMVYNLVTLVLYALTVYVMAPHGITAVCVGVLVVQAVNFVATHVLLLRRMLGIPLRSVAREVAPGSVASLGLLVVAYPLVEGLTSAGWGAVPVLLSATAVAAAVTVGVLSRLFPDAWADVMLGVRSVRAPRAAARSGDAAV